MYPVHQSQVGVNAMVAEKGGTVSGDEYGKIPIKCYAWRTRDEGLWY
jgi:hypothetical protein